MNVILHVNYKKNGLTVYRTKVFDIYHFDSENDVENKGTSYLNCSILEYITFRKLLNRLCKENAMIYTVHNSKTEWIVNDGIDILLKLS